MQPERIVLNNLIYGLKRSTVTVYSDAVKAGLLSFNSAQHALSELYAANKATANLPIEVLRNA